jgi:hypothetical protein
VKQPHTHQNLTAKDAKGAKEKQGKRRKDEPYRIRGHVLSGNDTFTTLLNPARFVDLNSDIKDNRKD